MVSSIRSTSFLLVFLLLPLIRFSTAHTKHDQGTKRMLVTTGSKLEMARSAVNIEIHHGVPDQRVRFVPGRKMMSRGVLSKSENGNIAKGSTTKEKALCLIGKCNHEEGKGIFLNMKRKFSKRSGHYKKAKMSGFVPLNADYYVPRPHPPKNN